MKIAIPSYQRYECPTLSLLGDVKDVTIFVANHEEEVLYKEKHPERKIVVGELGCLNQRNFITNYYEEGEMIVSLDDDIHEFKNYEGKTAKTILEEGCLALAESGLGMLTFSPTTNLYFAKKDKAYTEGYFFGIGVAHIYINHKELQLTVEYTHDFERSALYIKHYGKNLRAWNVCLEHYGWDCKGSAKKLVGGIGDSRTEATYAKQRNILLYKHNDILKAHKKKSSKVVSLQVRPRGLIPREKVFVLPPINPILMGELWEILKTKLTTFPKTKPPATQAQKDENAQRHRDGLKKKFIGGGGGRLGFPIYRYAVFGDVLQRVGNVRKPGVNNEKHKVLYELLMEIGNSICPFEFNQIQLAQDLVCPPHKDKKNVGDSMLISVGDYVGGEIVVEGTAYDARANPVIFNGGEMTHWNNDIISGTKFSFIFFTS